MFTKLYIRGIYYRGHAANNSFPTGQCASHDVDAATSGELCDAGEVESALLESDVLVVRQAPGKEHDCTCTLDPD